MKLKTIEEYYDLVAEDMPAIRRDRIDAEAAEIPALHDKYLKFLGNENEELRRMERVVAILRLVKTRYYMGKSEAEVYKTKLFNGKIFNDKVLKGDLPLYLEADEEMQAAEELIELQKKKVNYLKGSLEELSKRGFRMNNIQMDHRIKFGLENQNIELSALTEGSKASKSSAVGKVVILDTEDYDDPSYQ